MSQPTTDTMQSADDLAELALDLWEESADNAAPPDLRSLAASLWDAHTAANKLAEDQAAFTGFAEVELK